MSGSVSGSWYLYQSFANRLEMLRSGPTPEECSPKNIIFKLAV